MVANAHLTHTTRGYDYSQPTDMRPRSRQYDSFVVRLWQDESSDDMLRVELQHVQEGLSLEAVQVPLDWVLTKIMGCLQSPASEQTNANPEDEGAP